jgi:hypothetical protein
MPEDAPEKPPAPNLPKYLREPLEKQSPERLEVVATYASRRAEEEVDEDQLEELEERGVSTDPTDYDDVPTSGAYITVKTTKQTAHKKYQYFYWQWREGDSWKNEYIAPVDPQE